MVSKAYENLDKKLSKLKSFEIPNFLQNVYKQVAISNKGKQTNGEFRRAIDSYDVVKAAEFKSHLVFLLNKHGLRNHGEKLYNQNKHVMNMYVNETAFNPPYANGLKAELLNRNGSDHLFEVGKTKNIPIEYPGYETQEHPILMDGEQIGILTKVRGPGFDNTVYEGRIPGFVNKNIGIAKGTGIETETPVDKVILQNTMSNFSGFEDASYRRAHMKARKDGHTSLRFIN